MRVMALILGPISGTTIGPCRYVNSALLQVDLG